MLIKGIKYQFTNLPWQYQGKGGWYFVSIPPKTSAEIRIKFKQEEEGWGRLKAIVKIGNTEWKTSIWFDSKLQQYLLPIKTDVRLKETITTTNLVKVTLWV